MDKHKVLTGGQIDFTLDELVLESSSAQDALTELVKSLANGANIIVQGVSAVITNGVSAQVSAGWIYYAGELVKVEAQTVAHNSGIAGNLYQFNIVEVVDPEYSRTFRDGTTQNVATIRRGIVTQVSAVAQLDIQGQTLQERLAQVIQVQSDWNEADAGDPAFIQNKPILEKIYNVGKFSDLDLGAGSAGLSYTASGNVTSATLNNRDGNTNNVLVLFQNAHPSTNYRIDISIQSTKAGTNLKDDGQIRAPIWKVISSNSAIISIGEEFAVFQDLTVHLKTVYLG